MPLGFPGATAMVRVLVAKLTGLPPSRPACEALSMLRVSAEANTSAVAPWVSCVTRSEEPANENSTEEPGLSVLYWLAISVNADFSDAAANTVMEPAEDAELGSE